MKNLLLLFFLILTITSCANNEIEFRDYNLDEIPNIYLIGFDEKTEGTNLERRKTIVEILKKIDNADLVILKYFLASDKINELVDLSELFWEVEIDNLVCQTTLFSKEIGYALEKFEYKVADPNITQNLAVGFMMYPDAIVQEKATHMGHVSIKTEKADNKRYFSYYPVVIQDRDYQFLSLPLISAALLSNRSVEDITIESKVLKIGDKEISLSEKWSYPIVISDNIQINEISMVDFINDDYTFEDNSVVIVGDKLATPEFYVSQNKKVNANELAVYSLLTFLELFNS